MRLEARTTGAGPWTEQCGVAVRKMRRGTVVTVGNDPAAEAPPERRAGRRTPTKRKKKAHQAAKSDRVTPESRDAM